MEKSLEHFLEDTRQQFIRENILSDDFFDFMQNNTRPLNTLMAYYECAIMEIETKFKVLDKEFSLEYDRNPIETIKSRVKSMESILKKMKKKNLPITLEALEENLWDIAGVRVVCSFIDDIYYIADCFLKQDDITLIERKDYLQNPKPSGYRSLHLIVEVPIFLQNEKRPVKVEVQLRTIAMDFWASLEHKLRYKKNISDSEAELLAKELMECAQESAALDEKMQNIRNRISNLEKQNAKSEDQMSVGKNYMKQRFFLK